MSLLLFFYSFNDATVAPPVGNQIRLDAVYPYDTATRMFVPNETTDGMDIRPILLAMPIAAILRVQDKNDHLIFGEFEVIGAPVARVGYVEIPIVHLLHGSFLTNQAATLFARTASDTGTDVPGTGAGGDLVAFDVAKDHLGITDDDHDTLIASKLAMASATIRDYLTDRNDPTWDPTTTPFPIQAATLILLTDLYEYRGDNPDEKRAEAVWDRIALHLVRFRDPALA